MSGTTSGLEFSTAGDDTHMRVYRGKTISFEMIWGGSHPIDVTGYAAVLQIRDHKGALMLELSTANGKIIVGGHDGDRGDFLAAQFHGKFKHILTLTQPMN